MRRVGATTPARPYSLAHRGTSLRTLGSADAAYQVSATCAGKCPAGSLCPEPAAFLSALALLHVTFHATRFNRHSA